jgi:hypothetical protein
MRNKATVQKSGILALAGNRGNPRRVSNLPAGLYRKVAYSHPEGSTSRAWSRTLVGNKVLIATGAAGELDNQALAHEVRAIFEIGLGAGQGSRMVPGSFTYGKLCGGSALKVASRERGSLTRNDITSIHCVLILNEAEAIHELDLGDLTSAMCLEVSLDVCLGGIAGEVPEIEAGGRDLSHVAGSGVESILNIDLAWITEVSTGPKCTRSLGDTRRECQISGGIVAKQYTSGVR